MREQIRSGKSATKRKPVAKSPDSRTEIAAQPLPPGGRVKTATLPRQGNSNSS
jgi:hypothetical protein